MFDIKLRHLSLIKIINSSKGKKKLKTFRNKIRDDEEELKKKKEKRNRKIEVILKSNSVHPG